MRYNLNTKKIILFSRISINIDLKQINKEITENVEDEDKEFKRIMGLEHKNSNQQKIAVSNGLKPIRNTLRILNLKRDNLELDKENIDTILEILQ